MDNRKEVLQAARAKIAQGFTKGVLARDKDGVVTNFDGPNAVCFCILGALSAVSGGPYNFDPARDHLKEFIPGLAGKDVHTTSGFIAPVNDAPETTQTDVLSWFDAAIGALP